MRFESPQEAQAYLDLVKREKRACRCCEKGAVTIAPLQPRIVEKELASDQVVVETVVAKYSDHLPLYPAGDHPGPGNGFGLLGACPAQIH